MSHSPNKTAQLTPGHYALETFAASQKKRKRSQENSAPSSPAKMNAPGSPMRRPLSPWNKNSSKDSAQEPVMKKVKIAEVDAVHFVNQETVQADNAAQMWQQQIGAIQTDMKHLGEENDRLVSDISRLVQERELLLSKLVKAQESEQMLRQQLTKKTVEEEKLMLSFDQDMLNLEKQHIETVSKFEKSIAALNETLQAQQRELDRMKKEQTSFGRYREISMRTLVRSASDSVVGLIRAPTAEEIKERDNLRFQGVLPVMSFEHLPDTYAGFK